MNELLCVGIFFLIFAASLVLYGGILAKSGNKELLPYRAAYSVAGPQDVKRVGRIVVRVGLVIAACSLVAIVAAGGFA